MALTAIKYGAVQSPSYSFISDTNSGWYSVAGDQLGLTLGGTQQFTWSNSTLSFSQNATQLISAVAGTSSSITVSARKDLLLISNGNNDSSGVMTFSLNGSANLVWDGSALYPNSDNSFKVGKSGNRYSEVWAANGTIQTSDARLKQGINNITDGLSVVENLKPVTYYWTQAAETNFTFKGMQQSGFIAQDILTDLPDIPLGAYYDKYTDNYGFSPQQIIPYLVASIKQLKDKLDSIS